jgi:hypothetical protein
MTTDNFCLYLQNRLIQTIQTGVNGTVILPPLVFPAWRLPSFGQAIDIYVDGKMETSMLFSANCKTFEIIVYTQRKQKCTARAFCILDHKTRV